MLTRNFVIGFWGALILVGASSSAISASDQHGQPKAVAAVTDDGNISCIAKRLAPEWLQKCAQSPELEVGEGYYLVELRPGTDLQKLPLVVTTTDYVPKNSYLEWLTPKQVSTLPTDKVGFKFLSAAYKIDPSFFVPKTDCDVLVPGNVWFWYRNDRPPKVDYPSNTADGSADTYGFFQVSSPSFRRLVNLARLPEVVRVEQAGVATLRNATTSWVIQTNEPGSRRFFDDEIRGQGQVIGFIDDFVDRDHCFFRPACKFKGYRGGTSGGSQAPTKHGTFVAGILAGRKQDEPEYLWNGQAPEALLSFDSLDQVVGARVQVPKFSQALQNEYDDGARIFSNSWGDDSQTGYTGWVYEADRFSYRHEDALVLFAASNKETVRSPENARNVLAVAASAQANDQNYFGSGGSGPTIDCRQKPEIFAPGCRIRSSVVGHSADQCDLAFSAGPSFCSTSWACPAVAGAAALVRQYFVEGRYPTGDVSYVKRCPSGALVKAVLLNGAMDMVEVPEIGNTYPNEVEGWGRLNLDRSLYVKGESGSRQVRVLDFRRANGLRQGESICRKLKIKRASEPLQVTLVWMDQTPANVCDKSFIVNDLDLILARGADVYYGNAFNRANGESKTGGSADERNNVEQILIKIPSGEYTLRVSAKQVRGRRAKQGFALVVSGDLDGDLQACADKTSQDVDLTESMDKTCFQ